MNFKVKIKWKSHKGGRKWNWKCDTEEGGVDKYRIRLRRPGSHRLPETGVTDLKQVPAVDRFSCTHTRTPPPIFCMSYTLKQTHVKTCLHVIKRTVTCSRHTAHGMMWQFDSLCFWMGCSEEHWQCWQSSFCFHFIKLVYTNAKLLFSVFTLFPLTLCFNFFTY